MNIHIIKRMALVIDRHVRMTAISDHLQDLVYKMEIAVNEFATFAHTMQLVECGFYNPTSSTIQEFTGRYVNCDRAHRKLNAAFENIVAHYYQLHQSPEMWEEPFSMVEDICFAIDQKIDKFIDYVDRCLSDLTHILVRGSISETM